MRQVKEEENSVCESWLKGGERKQDVVQRGFRERGMEEGVREDEGGERGQTAGGS